MRQFLLRALLAAILLLINPEIFTLRAQNLPDSIPDVKFALFRLDMETYAVKGYYRFDVPMKKSLPDEGFRTIGDWFYEWDPPADFGSLSFKSRLTGQILAHIKLFWMSGGYYDWPADSLLKTDWQSGQPDRPPLSIKSLIFPCASLDSICTADPAQVDTAWQTVEATNIVEMLSDQPYEALVVAIGYLKEWLVIVNTRPHAPLNMAYLGRFWPDQLLTRNVYSKPEALIHNFSDDTLKELSGMVYWQKGGHWIYSSFRELPPLAPDETTTIQFDSFKVNDDEQITLHYYFLSTILGEQWFDLYPENDTASVQLRLTNQPIFRPISSVKHPGKVPLYGTPCDVDLDGDYDIVQAKYHDLAKVWLNSNGSFSPYTDTLQLASAPSPRKILCSDLNNDGWPDLLFIPYGKSPSLYLGDGTGKFRDGTAASGLDVFTTYWEAAVIDLENDGDKDLILQSYGQDVVLQNDGSGHFTEVTSMTGLKNEAQTQAIAVADLDQDGDQDVVFANWENLPKIYKNNGDGTFTAVAHHFSHKYVYNVYVLDANNDELPDILFTIVGQEDSSYLYLQTPELQFNQRIGLPMAFKAAIGDVNGDGWPDILLDRMEPFLFLNFNGVFYDYTQILIHAGDEIEHYHALAMNNSLLDLNGDGYTDIYNGHLVMENQGFDSTLTGLSNNNVKTVPLNFILEGNYPNPFNGSTKIRFRLNRPLPVKIEIYDIRGRKVKTLHWVGRLQGRQEVFWNGTNRFGKPVSSGCYFYRVVAGTQAKAGKMLLIR